MINDDARIAYGLDTAAVALGLERQVIERAIHSGALMAKKYGRLYLVGVPELHEWLDIRAEN